MNSFATIKTEVFEKIEESLRQCNGVEDLKDDEIAELCILSNEETACETTAILNPTRFVHAARLRFRKGFLSGTAARANGTMWDLSFEDDRTELRRVQDREQPKLLAGSPPSDD